MPIEDYVREGPTTSWHPLLRLLEAHQKGGGRAVFQLYRQPELLGYRKAKIYLYLFQNPKRYMQESLTEAAPRRKREICDVFRADLGHQQAAAGERRQLLVNHLPQCRQSLGTV